MLRGKNALVPGRFILLYWLFVHLTNDIDQINIGTNTGTVV